MTIQRIPAGAKLAIWVILSASIPALAQTPHEDLKRGIDLFDAGQYQEAQEVLLAIDRDALSDEQREQRDRYADEVRLAISLSAKADQDHTEAQRAMDGGEYDRAEMFFRAVLRNDYASTDLKTQSEQSIALIAEKRELGEALQESRPPDPAPDEPAATMPPEPARLAKRPQPDPPRNRRRDKQGSNIDPDRADEARALVDRGHAALAEGSYTQARDSFSAALAMDPGMPEAVQGLAEANNQEVAAEQSMSLVDRIRWQRNLLWVRTEAMYRQLEREVRSAVAQDDFDTAGIKALRARQVVQSGRAHADPVGKYEALLAEADELARFARQEQETWHQRDVQDKRDQALSQEEMRRSQFEDSRRVRVESLMEQADQFARERKLEQAINALVQVEAIDPSFERAKWRREDLENTLFLWNQQSFADELFNKQSDAFFLVEQAKMPHFEDIKYPKNWPEITAKRMPYQLGRFGASDPSAGVLRQLGAVTPRVSLDGIAFADALDELRDLGGFNLHVNWGELERAGIDRDTPINTNLKNVKLEKALALVLSDASLPDVPLAYEVDEGVVSISTKQDQDNRTVTRVYDIKDLVVHIPNFDDAPSIELKTTPEPLAPEDAAESLFDDNKDDSLAAANHNGSVIQKILDTIRDTIYPGTWRGQNGLIGSIRELNGQIIVTHTLKAQQQLTSLLDQLRETRTIQIGVETRFLTVRTNFLEEIGMDLDIILNTGGAGFDTATIADVNGLPVNAVDPATGGLLLLPRQFSRLGFIPSVPPLGTTLGNQITPFQPFGSPVMVPGSGSSGNVTPVPILSNVLGFTNPRGIQTGVPGSFAGAGFTDPALQIFGSFLDSIQVDFLLRATQADGRSTFLEAPRMTLSNGQRAFVAIVTQQAYVSALNAVVAQEVGQVEPVVSTLNTGSVLDVEATVGADRRYVTMTIRVGRAILEELVNVQVQSTGTSTRGVGAQIQLPRIQVSIIRTTVTVPEGGTVLLGGLKQTGEVELEGGVPILSKIPILKRAYSSRSTAKDESLLLILVKPSIIIQEEAEEDAFPAFSRR